MSRVEQHSEQAIGLMLLSVFFFSTMDVAFKMLVEDFNSFQVVFFRCSISFPMFATWILIRNRSLFRTHYPGGHLQLNDGSEFPSFNASDLSFRTFVEQAEQAEQAIPEPATLILFSLGLVLLGFSTKGARRPSPRRSVAHRRSPTEKRFGP